ncbi:MAG: GAF domain-containing protein, partial [Anaerolineae bacterium]|nr:GAF domain-containing protein [Anaerolineae bacterium]
HDLQRRRQPIIVTDAQIDQRAGDIRATLQREYNRAWAEFLVRKGDELIGVLVFYYNEPRHFSSEEQELLRNFTNQAAMALSNARLYTQTDETLKRRVEQLSALADTSRELTATLDLKGLFQLVLERAIEATKSHAGALLLRMDEHEPAPRLVAFRGIAFDAFEEHRLLTGYIAQTYETGLSTLIPDIRLDRAAVPLDTLTLSQLNVPVMRGEEVLGVISLGSDRAEDYTADDVSFVSQLATQARIAIDNARLFRRIEVARDRLQVILDSMKEAVVLISADGRISLANPRVGPLVGMGPGRIIGVPLEKLVADEELRLAERLGMQREVLLNLAHSLAAGQWDTSTSDAERVTFEIAGEEGVRFIDRTDAPVRGDEGYAIGLLMVFSDVTEERELARAREDLSNMIVHDLRGPLTAITTSLKLLGAVAPPGDALGDIVRQTTDGASTAVRKLLNLVDSLLDVSKLESGLMALQCRPTPLEPLCVDVMKELLPLAQELEIDLRLEMPPTLPMLFVDADQIERVLLNLVDNAIKFTPSGGQVVVEAYPPQQLGGHGKNIRVQIRDTGPGVPDEYKERLFDRFAQVEGQKTQRRGTGLGLTFCKLAVEAHGGRVWVEDSPQGGAVFVFTLPAAGIEDLN